MIIAVEGIDGAGKRTLVDAIRGDLDADVLAFPRYEDSAAAQLAQAALHGKMGDMSDSAYAMAAVFALDRHGARETLARYTASRERILILDRYSASNAAYTWARTGDKTAVRWVEDLEFNQLGLPRPDLQVLVDTPPEVAGQRAAHREAEDDSRTRDRYERDAGLQHDTYAAYRALAENGWAGPWVVSVEPAVIMQSITALR